MGEILIGTCSWSGDGLRGAFYPPDIQPHDMIAYYSQHFRLVEVDSTYYHMPRAANFKLWAERTPAGFVFDVKAYRQLTLHDRDQQPAVEQFQQFAEALRPVYSAGKLGAVLLQFPPWFRPSPGSLHYLEVCRERLPDYPLAVEFRHGSWLREGVADETLRFLRQHDLAYVSVDEPQFPGSTVPPLAAATTGLAVVRFHGRNRETWFKRDVGVEQRFNYLYAVDELMEWVPRIRDLATQAVEVHVLMNNCYADYSVRNARDVAQLLLV